MTQDDRPPAALLEENRREHQRHGVLINVRVRDEKKLRDLYATVLAEWLCVPIPLVEQHLLGHPYNPVNLGFNCSGVDFPDIAYDDEPHTPPTSP